MNTKQKLALTLSEYDLNQTQFYQAWSMGTLSNEALEVYANEYGNFIGQLSQGWNTLGDSEQARVEDEHYQLWQKDFCSALGVQISAITIPAIAELITSAQDMFSKKSEALGALYIFIAQQASTSQSKLEGIRRHYHLPTTSESYFEAHLGADALAEKLYSTIDQLSPEEQTSVVDAAHVFAQKLYSALESIYEKYPARS